MTNKDSPLPPTVQQASAGNNDKASHFSVDISELIREAYEVLRAPPPTPSDPLGVGSLKWV